MKTEKTCILCNRSQKVVPVTKFDFKDSSFYICSQHIPVLIHDPQKLVGLLPDADKMEGA